MSTITNIVTGQVVAGATAVLTANVKKISGASFQPEEMSAIEVTILDLGSYPNAPPTVVENFDGKALDIENVMFTPQKKTYNGVEYQRNFEWIPDIADAPFAEAGHVYQVTLTFTPVAGAFCSPLKFKIKAV